MAEKKDADLISKLEPEERVVAEKALRCISPDDSKYRKTSAKLADYLSASAEWMGYAFVQKVLLETRVEFGKAEQKHLDEVISALPKISPLNMDLHLIVQIHRSYLSSLQDRYRCIDCRNNNVQDIL